QYPPQAHPDGYAGSYGAPGPAPQHGRLPDSQAIERYRYLLRTAPPEQIEQAHAEAFAQLTVDQRQQVLAQLAAVVPSGERPRTDDPATLARVATRAEIRQPGILERALGGPGYGQGGYGQGGYGQGGYRQGGYGGPGMGSMIGGSLLGTIGGLVIGTAVADALFDTGMGDGGLFGGGDEGMSAEAAGGDYGDQAGGYGGDPDADFAGGADNAWDGGGGDFGGGDFGGGDF
ncbi:MAG: hypothetical protein ACLGI3_00640, partial [Actinomycetes bacterium]